MSSVPLLIVDEPLKHASAVLIALGFFSLVACVAMLMRTGMAKGSGEAIPDDPSADVVTKAGRFIARGESSRVPVYRGMWQLFLGLGIALVIVGLVLLLVAYL
jgi:protein-S-isoprenylcysteine O-methyltransferase Ste14